ncbi:hypothetical protein Pcinc_008297 [Petrolisthes cinctipes]|uniref:Uncharacterized protein n=1 Tax=Petrolisthes cinctipes TaxID=88211 RepID=A0AAE1G6S4_PETCI|nr:hypothetical protein Pcinc_008297 [Petrolisthes cinctipes]
MDFDCSLSSPVAMGTQRSSSCEKRREAGVSFTIRTQHLKKLASIPGFDDHLMKFQLPLGRKRTATVIIAYAPTMTNPEETKDGFYEKLDAIITAVPQAKDRWDVHGDCWTSHRLIISKLNIHIQPQRRPQGQQVAKRLDVFKLKCSPIASFTLPPSRYSARPQETIRIGSMKTMPKLLEEKCQLLRAHQNYHTSTAKKAAFVSKCSIVKARLLSMQDAWLSSKADEIQGFADRHDTKRFYDALKAVYGPPSCGSSPLLSADGTTLLKGKKEILERWAEHFDSVLNRPSSINNEVIARLPQVAINPDLDIPPSVEEVAKAFKQMSSGKAPGPDAIPAEVFKFGGPTLLKRVVLLGTPDLDRSYKSPTARHLLQHLSTVV